MRRIGGFVRGGIRSRIAGPAGAVGAVGAATARGRLGELALAALVGGLLVLVGVIAGSVLG